MTTLNKENVTTAPSTSTKQKVLYIGTGDFALPILEALIADKEKTQVVAVVTAPDGRVGRGNRNERKSSANPIKDVALAKSIPLAQPEKITVEAIEHLANLKPDIIIVASYGKILPQALLDSAPFGAINVHPSLLPKLRGASPIQNALLLGEEQTGVTIIKMTQKLDAGPIFTQVTKRLSGNEVFPDLEKTLSALSAETILDVLPRIIDRSLKAVAQSESNVTLCQLISREDGQISWLQKSDEIFNRYRALVPWPGIFTFWRKSPTENIRIKLLEISPHSTQADLTRYATATVFTDEDQLCVRTIDGAIRITKLQREGKSPQSSKDFLNGNPQFVGARLA